MRIKIYYPSGHVLHLSGKWKGPGNVKGFCVILIWVDKDCPMPGGTIIKAGSAVLGDLRGLYCDEDEGRILYNPRECIEGMDTWAIDWLNKHPEWPGVLEIV